MDNWDFQNWIANVKWGDVATWLSAIATTFAGIAALYLANRSDKPRAKGGLKLVLFSPNFETRYTCFEVANLGTHSIRINTCFIEYPRWVAWAVPWPSAMANNWQHFVNSSLPADIQRGESFRYTTEGVDAFGDYFADSRIPAFLAVQLVRAGVMTPWGPIYLPISKELKRRWTTYIREKRAADIKAAAPPSNE